MPIGLIRFLVGRSERFKANEVFSHVDLPWRIGGLNLEQALPRRDDRVSRGLRIAAVGACGRRGAACFGHGLLNGQFFAHGFSSDCGIGQDRFYFACGWSGQALFDEEPAVLLEGQPGCIRQRVNSHLQPDLHECDIKALPCEEFRRPRA